MPLSSTSCSEPPTTTGPQDGPVVVLEGMPGAGKTTAARMLADDHMVIGEYTTAGGDIVEVDAHPTVEDDDAHQRNWLIKHRQVAAARPRGPVFVDRDWLTALAYAHSVAATDDGALLAERARWAQRCLHRGDLGVATVYVLFPLDPATSLQRRAHRLIPGHPWSSLQGLHRLATFYADPVAALELVASALAVSLRRATWLSLQEESTLERAVEVLRDLAIGP
ncbi:AAA family ATPase [Frankia sp. Cr1]|uniref:AAA family ATPase n=1 Tax=Frankia sp. Cr1 TaxID=3073931 RepID=UPI002AD3CBF7|nr:AAA family ATPase [Frankia sp. Cr1]